VPALFARLFEIPAIDHFNQYLRKELNVLPKPGVIESKAGAKP
jgi:hypothetical protein